LFTKAVVFSQEKRALFVIYCLAVFSNLKATREIDFIPCFTGKKKPFRKMRAFHVGTRFFHSLFFTRKGIKQGIRRVPISL
jgi:hypothetical protein